MFKEQSHTSGLNIDFGIKEQTFFFHFFQFPVWLCGSLSLVIYRVLMELCVPISLVLGKHHGTLEHGFQSEVSVNQHSADC